MIQETQNILFFQQQIFGENYASLGQCGCNSSTILALLQTAPELKGPPGPPGITGADGRTGAPGLPVRALYLYTLNIKM